MKRLMIGLSGYLRKSAGMPPATTARIAGKRDVRVDPSRSFSSLRHRFRELEQRLRSMEAYVTSDAYRVHKEINDLER